MNAQDRNTQIIQAINEWNNWLTPEAREEKYAKMAASPFVFYRGTNHLFWMDFAGDERLARFGDEHTHTWLQGDLHAENFGAFTNDEGRVAYSVNDFDESIFAHYQYDVWRMAISLGIGMDGVIEQSDQVKVITRFARAYLETLQRFCKNDKNARDFYDSLFVNDAQRAVIAYKAMTQNTDDYLGWMRLPDGSYLVRERTFVKEAFPLKELTDAKDFKKMAKQWGKILATVHAHADRLPGISHMESFEQRVTELVKKRQQAFEGLVCEVALGYAETVKGDWEGFVGEFAR